MEIAPLDPPLFRVPLRQPRFHAWCVDTLATAAAPWLVKAVLARWLTSGGIGFVVLLAASATVLALPVIRGGATLGQRMFGLRLVDFRSQGTVTTRAAWYWALMRSLVGLCLAYGEETRAVFLLLPHVGVLYDTRHARSLYDDWAGVWVVSPALAEAE